MGLPYSPLPSPAQGVPDCGWGEWARGCCLGGFPLVLVTEGAAALGLSTSHCASPSCPCLRVSGTVVMYSPPAFPLCSSDAAQVPDNFPDYQKYYRQMTKVPHPTPLALFSWTLPVRRSLSQPSGASCSDRRTGWGSTGAPVIFLTMESFTHPIAELRGFHCTTSHTRALSSTCRH